MNQSRLITLLVSCLMALTAMAQDVVHTVERGETLESIAGRYGVTTGQITTLNPDAAQFIYVGMQLTIPVSDSVKNSVTSATETYAARPAQGTPQQPAAVMTAGEGYTPAFADVSDMTVGDIIMTAQYQTLDCRDFKKAGMYGLGMRFTSIARCDWLHIGAELEVNLNAGLVDDSNCIINFGPSLRADIIRNVFVTLPVDVMCIASFKGTDTHTDWGMHIAPSIYGYFTDKFGVFVGPNVSFGFSGGDATVGMQCGLAFSF